MRRKCTVVVKGNEAVTADPEVMGRALTDACDIIAGRGFCPEDVYGDCEEMLECAERCHDDYAACWWDWLVLKNL